MGDKILTFLEMDLDSLQQTWISNIQQKHRELTVLQANASPFNTSSADV